MATTDDQLVTAKGLAQSLSGALGSVVLYNDRPGTTSVTLSEPVTAFSAIEVTVGYYNDTWKKNMNVADFTMVHPETSDVYNVSVPDGSGTFNMGFAVSGDGKTIRKNSSSVGMIVRIVGHR